MTADRSIQIDLRVVDGAERLIASAWPSEYWPLPREADIVTEIRRFRAYLAGKLVGRA